MTLDNLLGLFQMPHDASVHGWRIDSLIQITNTFILIMFGVVVLWIAISMLFHGRKHRAEYDTGDGKKQMIKAACLSVLIFGVVDGNLFLSGMADLNDAFWDIDRAEASPHAVRVQVNAHQWAWDFRQAGADGAFNTADDIVSLNELRVPVGAPVVFQIGATDVLHSLSFPNMRVKQDAVPGTITRLWFQAKETGAFDIACAQHCGTHHYKMRGKLIVMTKAEYSAWSTEASKLGQRGHDPEDRGAMWGWNWEKARP
jgi:cytochrome c oxidase subunit II